MHKHPANIAVIGAGSWGTALAVLLASNGANVSLWGHEPDVMQTLATDRENKTFLPGVSFPETLKAIVTLEEALEQANEVLIVVPSHAFGAVLKNLATKNPDLSSISWATKGFNPHDNRMLSELAAEYFPNASHAVVTGPTFAMETAKQMPTALTVAATSTEHAERLVQYMHNKTCRPYIADDIIGVQVGGAAKNIMAIAAGISDGLKFGANARSALITRGLAEITRLGLALGGKPETFMGLAGLGDLVLTCTDDQSRNRRMGLALARGLTIDEAKTEIGQEVEGINTAREVFHKASALGVEMPITEQTYKVLFEGLSPKQAVSNLLGREARSE